MKEPPSSYIYTYYYLVRSTHVDRHDHDYTYIVFVQQYIFYVLKCLSSME